MLLVCVVVFVFFFTCACVCVPVVAVSGCTFPTGLHRILLERELTETHFALQLCELRDEVQKFTTRATNASSLAELYESLGPALRTMVNALAGGQQTRTMRATLGLLLPHSHRPSVPVVKELLGQTLQQERLSHSAHVVLSATGLLASYSHNHSQRDKRARDAAAEAARTARSHSSVMFCTLDNAERRIGNRFGQSTVRLA